LSFKTQRFQSRAFPRARAGKSSQAISLGQTTKSGQRDYSRRRQHGRRMSKSRAIKGIDEDMKLNKALWQMAEVLCARAKHNNDYIKPNRGVTSTPELIRNNSLNSI
jgi:hypothetical protein